MANRDAQADNIDGTRAQEGENDGIDNGGFHRNPEGFAPYLDEPEIASEEESESSEEEELVEDNDRLREP